MRVVFNYLIVAGVLGTVALGLFVTSGIDQRVARAQQQVSTFELVRPEVAYADLESYLDVADTLPWLFGDTRAAVTARRATLRYWRGEYGSLLADYSDSSDPAVSGNLELQFVLANAAYRAGLERRSETAEVLQALDGAIGVYLGVLQDSPDHQDAAHNYEYLLRLRADIASGGEIPVSSQTPHGQEGETPEDSDLEEIKIYIPVQRDVDPEMDESPTLGAGGRIQKRG